jgi:hypothetical protein
MTLLLIPTNKPPVAALGDIPTHVILSEAKYPLFMAGARSGTPPPARTIKKSSIKLSHKEWRMLIFNAH